MPFFGYGIGRQRPRPPFDPPPPRLPDAPPRYTPPEREDADGVLRDGVDERIWGVDPRDGDVERLGETAPLFERDPLLRCMTDRPVLLWGAVPLDR